jgi:hypothetical protein
MDLVDGIMVIEQAIEGTQRDQAYQLWISVYPHMENPPTFEKFYQPKNHVEQPTLTKDEIIARAERIKMADQGKGGK